MKTIDVKKQQMLIGGFVAKAKANVKKVSRK